MSTSDETEVGVDDVAERWLPVTGHPDYEVSSLGRVRCCRARRYLKPGDLIAQQTMRSGYLVVNLDGHPRLAHRLVCAAFHGQPSPERPEVAHNNGVRGDNRASNLRWASRRENMADILLHGTSNPPRGEANGHAILRTQDVHSIRTLRKMGMMQREIARRYGVSRTTVSAILNGYNWKHVEDGHVG